MENRNVNHHSAAVFPFYIGPNGMEILFERKDYEFRPPFLDGALNALGGNGHYEQSPDDTSPMAILEREICEEFWLIYEKPEDLNRLVGEEFVKTRPAEFFNYNDATIGEIRKLVGTS